MSRQIVYIFLFLAIIVLLDSCKKPEPAKVVITVLDDANAIVQGATVRIYSKPSDSIIEVTKQSDVSGRASFEFDTDYVLNVHCEKKINESYTADGDGVIEIHVNATAEKTITIK